MNCIKCNIDIQDDSKYCFECGAKQSINTKKSKKNRGNGQGSVYKLPNGKWRAVTTQGYIPLDNDEEIKKPKKKRIYKTKSGFKTKKEALDYISILNAEYTVIKKVRISQIYEIWSKSHYATISKSAQSTYKTAYKKISNLHSKYISDIKMSDMQKIVDEIEDGYYPKRDIKILMNHLFQYAMIEDYCIKNYAEYIKLPPLEKSKKDAFTIDERNLLWADYEIGNEFTGYILIMIYTGMRYGEISTIFLENIFLDKKYMIGGIKTDAGKNRVIAIPEKIFDIVTNLYHKGNIKLLEMPEAIFYSKYKDTLERSKVRQLNVHCCRHTFSTMMAEAGVQPAIIKEAAGHKNYSTTIGYTHISLNDKLEAVNISFLQCTLSGNLVRRQR